jgi:2-dehydro-3-deoxygluconokinase
MISTFGEIMLRISPDHKGERLIQSRSFRIEPGGSESNVAIALANLGMPVSFISCLPENELSELVVRYLKHHSVDISKIIFNGNRIGTYWTENGSGPRNSFVIYDRENSAFSKSGIEDYNFQQILAGSEWFHFSGISPAVSESVAQLLQKAVEVCPCPYSVDLNFREKLWGWVSKDNTRIGEIMANLCQRAELIAGNETDFQNIFGIESSNESKRDVFKEIAEKVFSRFPILKYIAISNRQSVSATINHWNGFLFVRSDDQFIYEGKEYVLDSIEDRVGTGDSFVAGIIYGLVNIEKTNYQEIIDFAVTLSALNHTTLGDASCFSVSDVQKTLKTGGSGRIVR